jgi:outer membrane protein TolC
MKIVFVTINLIVLNISAMTIDDYMKEVEKKNKVISSYDLSIEAADEKKTAGDIGLAPVLTAGYSVYSDKSQPSVIADRRDLTSANLGLSKKFSSGTSFSLNAETYKNDFFSPVTPGNNGYSTGKLGVSLQQSLWKDSFGHATRLRRTRESATAKLEQYSNTLKKRAAIIQAESDFWDYLVAQEDLKLKKANLDRAKKLESWTSNRVYNGISEQSDLLQIKALVSRRELELNSALDELEAKSIKIKENLGLSTSEAIPSITSDLKDIRPYVNDLMKNEKMIKIENYLSQLEAEIKQSAAEETVDALRPDLSLVGRYSTTSYDPDYSKMQNSLSDTDRPISYIGLSFSWVFGADAVSSQKSSAKKEAIASTARAEQAKLIGENAWIDHLRRYKIAKQNVDTLEKIVKLQNERSKQEQIRFTKGRTITSNVVNAETDFAEAEVSFLRGKSGLRKLEAATLLFTKAE